MAEQSTQLLQDISIQLRESESRQVNAQEETTGAVTGLTNTFMQFFKHNKKRGCWKKTVSLLYKQS